MTLNDVKLYLRIDGTNEDNLINELITASESYMRDAISDFDDKKADPEWLAKAEQAQRLLIADWFENRLPTARPANAAVTLIITQLQL